MAKGKDTKKGAWIGFGVALVLGIIYNIAADEKTGDIFLMELDSDYTAPGSVHCFSNEGKLKYTVPRVGINPTAVIVMN